MLNEKNGNEMEIEKNQKNEKNEVIPEISGEKIEEKKNVEEKPKKKIIKRAPMEKTVDKTIKEFDKLLQDEVSNFLNFMFRSLIHQNLNLYLRN